MSSYYTPLHFTENIILFAKFYCINDYEFIVDCSCRCQQKWKNFWVNIHKKGQKPSNEQSQFCLEFIYNLYKFSTIQKRRISEWII